MPWVPVTDPNELAAAQAELAKTAGGGKPVDPAKAAAMSQAQAAEKRRIARAALLARQLGERATDMGDVTSGYQPTTGFVGRVLSNIPGTPAYNYSQDVETLKANIQMDELARLKASSPNGSSGLGATTGPENDALRALLGNLNVGQSKEQFRKNIGKVEGEYVSRIRAVDPKFGFIKPPVATPKPMQKPAASDGWSVKEKK